MRIAIVTPVLERGDGQGRVNLEVARTLLGRGHDVVILARSAAPELRAHPNVEWVRLRGARWPSALLRDVLAARHSAQWLRAHRDSLDAVLANGCITRAPADVNAAHFVHHAWRREHASLAPGRGLRGLYHRVYTALNVGWERTAFQSARVVVAVSEQVRRELIEAQVPPERIRIIPNGVDTTEFFPGPVDRSALGLPPDGPLGLFVGDLQTPRKNLDTVLRAMVDVPDLHLAVVGRREGSPYPTLAHSLGLDGRVHFLGYRPDVADLMRAADLVVCPSRYEPFSLVVLEAMASGCPVVTARTVGAAPIVAPDCGAVLDDPDDAPALASALTALLEAPDRRAQMGRAARARALKHTWETVGTQYADLLERLSRTRRSVALSSSSL